MAKVIDTAIEAATAAAEPVVDLLVQRGLPATRDSYVALAYSDESPALDAESEAIVHEALAQYRAAVAAEKAIRRARTLARRR